MSETQNYILAEQDYMAGMKYKDIADKYGVSLNTVKSWKVRHKWDKKSVHTKSEKVCTQKKKHGGQPGNKNAEKFGFFSKYLPEETVSIIQEMPADPLDVLWDQIQIAYAAIIRAQQIMYVRDRDDLTTTQIQEKNGDSVTEERWEVQQAWDKQASFLKAQARAQSELRSMIRQYKELAERVGGKQEAIDRLDEILKGVRENAAKQEAE